MGLKAGRMKAYPRRQGAVAATYTQGKGREDQTGVGKADPSVTVYTEQVNDVTRSRLTAFIERAATELSVAKSELIIEDIAGHKMLGESSEMGTNVRDGIPRLM